MIPGSSESHLFVRTSQAAYWHCMSSNVVRNRNRHRGKRGNLDVAYYCVTRGPWSVIGTPTHPAWSRYPAWFLDCSGWWSPLMAAAFTTRRGQNKRNNQVITFCLETMRRQRGVACQLHRDERHHCSTSKVRNPTKHVSCTRIALLDYCQAICTVLPPWWSKRCLVLATVFIQIWHPSPWAKTRSDEARRGEGDADVKSGPTQAGFCSWWWLPTSGQLALGLGLVVASCLFGEAKKIVSTKASKQLFLRCVVFCCVVLLNNQTIVWWTDTKRQPASHAICLTGQGVF